MLESELGNRLFSYAFYSLAVVTLLASILSYNFYFVGITALLIFASVLYMHSGHMINNFLLGRGKVIEVYNGYKLSENLTSAVKRISNDYYSVSCALLGVPGGEHNGELIASLISKIDFPFEFSLGMKSVDRARLIDGLEMRRRLKEIEIGRTDAKRYEKANNLRRELGIIESEIRSIKGLKPLALVVRLKAFASAPSELEAARSTSQHIEQLASTFSPSLGSEYEILKGEKLIEQLSLEGVSA